jgi:hypothetical protein
VLFVLLLGSITLAAALTSRLGARGLSNWRSRMRL